MFPGLDGCEWKPTSPEALYNCISWAVSDPRRRWWEPTPSCYWPPGVPREYTVNAFQQAFEACGFSVCSSAVLEEGFDKVALYAAGDEPQHAARQLPMGSWTSKLGLADDIEHETLDALEGDQYGKVVLIMKRPTRSEN